MPRSFVVLALVAAAGLLVVASAIGLVSLWPRGELRSAPSAFAGHRDRAGARQRGERVRVPRGGGRTCARVSIELLSGPDDGKTFRFTVGDLGRDLALDEGDRDPRLPRPVPEDAQIGGVPVDRYALADFERRLPLLWLALGFAALVIGLGRLRGFRALLGLVISLPVVVEFVCGEKAIVGSIGLIAAVPVMTALAAVLATRLPPAALADDHAGHAH